jgi:hypothetical protein
MRRAQDVPCCRITIEPGDTFTNMVADKGELTR